MTTEERFPLTFLLQIQNEMSGEFPLAAGEIQHVDTASTKFLLLLNKLELIINRKPATALF